MSLFITCNPLLWQFQWACSMMSKICFVQNILFVPCKENISYLPWNHQSRVHFYMQSWNGRCFINYCPNDAPGNLHITLECVMSYEIIHLTKTISEVQVLIISAEQGLLTTVRKINYKVINSPGIEWHKYKQIIDIHMYTHIYYWNSLWVCTVYRDRKWIRWNVNIMQSTKQ